MTGSAVDEHAAGPLTLLTGYMAELDSRPREKVADAAFLLLAEGAERAALAWDDDLLAAAGGSLPVRPLAVPPRGMGCSSAPCPAWSCSPVSGDRPTGVCAAAERHRRRGAGPGAPGVVAAVAPPVEPARLDLGAAARRHLGLGRRPEVLRCCAPRGVSGRTGLEGVDLDAASANELQLASSSLAPASPYRRRPGTSCTASRPCSSGLTKAGGCWSVATSTRRTGWFSNRRAGP